MAENTKVRREGKMREYCREKETDMAMKISRNVKSEKVKTKAT